MIGRKFSAGVRVVGFGFIANRGGNGGGANGDDDVTDDDVTDDASSDGDDGGSGGVFAVGFFATCASLLRR